MAAPEDYEVPKAPVRDDSALAPDEDLDREPDGVPHDVIGEFGPTKVVIKPATPGTGVIAGHAVRAVLEGAGIKDVRTKIIGSSNPYNVLEATRIGLLRLRSAQSVASARGLDAEQIGYEGQ